MRKWIFSIFLLVGSLHAENVNFAIIGGGNGGGNGTYAGILGPHSTTIPQMIQLPAGTPMVRTVAINNSGVCLVGCGYNTDTGGYAVRIEPGSLIPQTLNLPDLLPVRDMVINDAEIGFAGCGGAVLGDGYSARILPNSNDPESIDLPPGTNGIRRVAINQTGLTIIGGCLQSMENTGYAAYVPPGSTTPQPIGGSTNINYVAINHSGKGLIGGGWLANGYAAFFAPDGRSLQTFAPSVAIQAVAINDAGTGLIGGYNGSDGYAALIAADSPDLQPIAIPSHLLILAVDINNSGEGLIGGGSLTSGYAALIAPDGTVTSLALPASVTYPILSVAINNQGVGLIGSQTESGVGSYASLVAPDGTLTPLDIPLGSGVDFVDINDQFITSVGPYLSAVNTQLAAIYALAPRFAAQKIEMPEEIYLADNTDDLAKIYREKPRKYSFWATPFGDYVHSSRQGKIPAFTNEIVGVLAAFDYHRPNLLLGGALGYAFNSIHYQERIGHGHLQEECACVYSSFKKSVAWIQTVLWGGIYQVVNDRHMLSVMSATAHFSGWVLAPEIEISFPFALTQARSVFVEPFLMMDWVNNRQGHFTEKGISGFNLVMKSLYSSLLQSEFGLRFYEHFDSNWGRFSLIEKISYVNQAPFHVERATTYFLIPTSPFPIETGSSRIQNLGGIQLCGHFLPKNNSYPYGNLSLQGLIGSKVQSYFVNLEIGKQF